MQNNIRETEIEIEFVMNKAIDIFAKKDRVNTNVRLYLPDRKIQCKSDTGKVNGNLMKIVILDGSYVYFTLYRPQTLRNVFFA